MCETVDPGSDRRLCRWRAAGAIGLRRLRLATKGIVAMGLAGPAWPQSRENQIQTIVVPFRTIPVARRCRRQGLSVSKRNVVCRRDVSPARPARLPPARPCQSRDWRADNGTGCWRPSGIASARPRLRKKVVSDPPNSSPTSPRSAGSMARLTSAATGLPWASQVVTVTSAGSPGRGAAAASP